MSQTAASQRLYVFENLLSTVVQAYYKSTYVIESMCLEMKQEPVKIVGLKASRTRDKRRKGIHKLHKTEPKGDRRTDQALEDDAADDDYIDSSGILDYLVSPLKVDFEFGQLIRELVDKGNCDI